MSPANLETELWTAEHPVLSRYQKLGFAGRLAKPHGRGPGTSSR